MVLVCIGKLHGEFMLMLKLGINLSVAWNCLHNYAEEKEKETVEWGYLKNYAEGN
jgi:hypothetical protein